MKIKGLLQKKLVISGICAVLISPLSFAAINNSSSVCLNYSSSEKEGVKMANTETTISDQKHTLICRSNHVKGDKTQREIGFCTVSQEYKPPKGQYLEYTTNAKFTFEPTNGEKIDACMLVIHTKCPLNTRSKHRISNDCSFSITGCEDKFGHHKFFSKNNSTYYNQLTLLLQ